MVIENQQKLTAAVNPSTACQDVIWETASNNGVITINDKGIVTALKPGSAEVRVVSKSDSSIFTRFAITVVDHMI